MGVIAILSTHRRLFFLMLIKGDIYLGHTFTFSSNCSFVPHAPLLMEFPGPDLFSSITLPPLPISWAPQSLLSLLCTGASGPLVHCLGFEVGWVGAVHVWERAPGDRDGGCDRCSLHATTAFSLSICF